MQNWFGSDLKKQKFILSGWRPEFPYPHRLPLIFFLSLTDANLIIAHNMLYTPVKAFLMKPCSCWDFWFWKMFQKQTLCSKEFGEWLIGDNTTLARWRPHIVDLWATTQRPGLWAIAREEVWSRENPSQSGVISPGEGNTFSVTGLVLNWVLPVKLQLGESEGSRERWITMDSFTSIRSAYQ